jgi:hypothetical protein
MVCRAPGFLPADPAAGLLDQPVLRELPQVERARPRRLAEHLTGSRRRQWPLGTQQPHQRHPHRMRIGPQRPRIRQPGNSPLRLHPYKAIFAKLSLERLFIITTQLHPLANPVVVTTMASGAPGCDNHGVGLEMVGGGGAVVVRIMGG